MPQKNSRNSVYANCHCKMYGVVFNQGSESTSKVSLEIAMNRKLGVFRLLSELKWIF